MSAIIDAPRQLIFLLKCKQSVTEPGLCGEATIRGREMFPSSGNARLLEGDRRQKPKGHATERPEQLGRDREEFLEG